MAASISFNGQAITDKLDVFIKSELPWIAVQTLNHLAKEVKKDLQHEMVDSFTYLSPFTYNSIGWTYAKIGKMKANGTDYAEVFHKDTFSKANQPADYLKPLVTGGPVYLTRFQKRLDSKGITGPTYGRYMMPIHNAPGVNLNREGRLANSEYVKALWGIRAMEDVRSSGKYGKRNYKTAGSYVWIPPRVDEVAPQYGKTLRVINQKASGQYRLPPKSGIYRVDKGGLTQIFKQLKNVPKVSKDHYLFSFTGEQSVQKNYQRFFRMEAAKYARR